MTKIQRKVSRIEAILWSIALPGFGQLLNGRVVKGLVFILIEFVVNLNSNLNLSLMYSFQWDFLKANNSLNFEWVLFYPCFYMFAMWDAFKEADGPTLKRFTYMPFVCGAIIVTVAIFYSTDRFYFGRHLGPVFFPILSLVPGLMIGFLIKWVLEKTDRTVDLNS